MSSENKIEFYFLRSSAERFAADLKHFAKYAERFSDEQLFRISSYCDQIKDNMNQVKEEMENRMPKN